MAPSVTPATPGCSCNATRLWIEWMKWGRSSSMRAAMYGTTCSRLKLASVLGMTISLSWILHVGHHVSTRGAPVPANPATVLPPICPDVLVSPARY